ncbi:MAG: Nif3-like dinuclear metal center hexameric protein [Bacteroidales bacterium]|nr:Nif3-like dinuclear metal center hexameric protein [Clostridium sp.]MCM1202952.1 Nif3-like dinuclear metal center hexameric protein [Bacteroidales bacterium]
MTCEDIIRELEKLSPKAYACDWDNVGLLVGRKQREVHKIMVALDASKEVVDYAVREQADMLITHHPMIFSAIKKVNEEEFTSEKVLTLAEQGIACYAMHTNFDTVGGMAQLAAGEKYLNLSGVRPIESRENDEEGMGRYGLLPYPMTAKQAAEYVKEKFKLPFVLLYQAKEQRDKVYDRIAVMPGSGKSEMKEVVRQGYSLYLTGDYGHHEALDAMDMGLAVIDATHYGLEHIFISYISEYLRKTFKDLRPEIVEADMGCPGQLI